MRSKKVKIHENQLSLFDEMMMIQEEVVEERIQVPSTPSPITLHEVTKALDLYWQDADDLIQLKQCSSCGKFFMVHKHKNKTCSCADYSIALPEEQKMEVGKNCIRGIHVYPESDDVIRFSFYEKTFIITKSSVLKESFKDEALEEIGYIRYHLDGTIEQSGECLDLSSEQWVIGTARKRGGSGLTDNLEYHSSLDPSYVSYSDLGVSQKIYYHPELLFSPRHFKKSMKVKCYLKVDDEIKSLAHPVARRHPYFYVMNTEASQVIGKFASEFVGCQEMFTRYPQMEQITKSGYQQIMQEWVTKFAVTPTKKFQLNRVFKPGKNLVQIMGLNKNFVRILREENVSYKLFQTIVKTNNLSPLHEESLRILIEISDELDLNRFWQNIREQRAEAIELLMYLRSCWNQQGIPASEALWLWQDYYLMAIESEMPFKKFPPMLKLAHDVLARDVKKIRDVKEQEMFKARAEALDFLNFEDTETGFGVYVPQTCNDLILEGRSLHHCVGSYQRRFAKGETTILFIRNMNAPKRSLYTLEWDLKGKRVIQLKGKSNSQVHDRQALACLKKWKEQCAALA